MHRKSSDNLLQLCCRLSGLERISSKSLDLSDSVNRPAAEDFPRLLLELAVMRDLDLQRRSVVESQPRHDFVRIGWSG